MWNGAFISANYNNWFGEVSHNTEQPQCSEMGNGLKASDESAASITNISNVFAGYSPRPASITVHEPTDPKYYTVTKVSDTSMRYGGVGVC